jgi:hypothetical protein
MSRSYTSSPPKHLHGVKRDCFTLLLWLCWLCLGGDGSDRGIGVELFCYLVVTGCNCRRLAFLFTCANTREYSDEPLVTGATELFVCVCMFVRARAPLSCIPSMFALYSLRGFVYCVHQLSFLYYLYYLHLFLMIPCVCVLYLVRVERIVCCLCCFLCSLCVLCI